MSIVQSNISMSGNLLKSKKNRRKQRHKKKIQQQKEKQIKQYDLDINHNSYDTWKSETIKPITQKKNYYLYYKLIEELKNQIEAKKQLVDYIEETYETIDVTIDEMDEDINKNSCVVC